MFPRMTEDLFNPRHWKAWVLADSFVPRVLVGAFEGQGPLVLMGTPVQASSPLADEAVIGSWSAILFPETPISAAS